jgi:hypothetical protein
MWYFNSKIIKHPKAIVTTVNDTLYTENILYTEEILYTAEDVLPEGKKVDDVKHEIGDVKHAKGDVKHIGGDIKHPKEIFRDSAMLTSLGIKPYRESTHPDSRYYDLGAFTVDESGDEVVGTYAGVAKDVAKLKENMLEVINEEVATRQGAIDWYWVRAEKGGTAVPANIATYATTIYSEQATKEGEVAALDTLDKIKEYENRPYTEVRKVSVYDDEGNFVEYSGTKSFAREINMCKHWTANPTDEADPEFVSLTAD